MDLLRVPDYSFSWFLHVCGLLPLKDYSFSLVAVLELERKSGHACYLSMVIWFTGRLPSPPPPPPPTYPVDEKLLVEITVQRVGESGTLEILV